MTLRHQDTRKEKKRNLVLRVFSVLALQCLSVFLVSSVLVSWCLAAEKYQKICFQQHCFTVEIADNSAKQRRGLMYRTQMPADHGMLFVFQNDRRYAFWMKNTLIPLDMIWLDQNLRIVYFETDVPPCEQEPCVSYQPPIEARYVLELNAGVVKKKGLKIGNILTLSDMNEKREVK